MLKHYLGCAEWCRKPYCTAGFASLIWCEPAGVDALAGISALLETGDFRVDFYAKRPATRQKRIEETVRLAEDNIRANHKPQ